MTKRRILQEAAIDRYWKMFEPVYDKILPASGLKEIDPDFYEDVLSTRDDARKIVAWAVKLLKKQDRITWFLRKVRTAIVMKTLAHYRLVHPKFGSAKSALTGKEKQDFAVILKNTEAVETFLEKSMFRLFPFSSNLTVRTIQLDSIRSVIHFARGSLSIPLSVVNELEHFFENPVPPVEQYSFEHNKVWQEVINDLKALEREWNEKQARYIGFDEMDPDDPDPEEVEVVIQFKDGSQWLNLNKPYCNLEARAMGHCGNAASYGDDDTILSYRTVEKHPRTGEEMWVPHLTFVLDEDGYLGEMKGYANNKPDKKYHPVIIELLKLSMIKGIYGGGYLSENNFSLLDLPEKTRDQLIEINPDLANPHELYLKDGGFSDRVKKKLSNTHYQMFEKASTRLIPPRYSEEYDVFIFKKIKELGLFAYHYGLTNLLVMVDFYKDGVDPFVDDDEIFFDTTLAELANRDLDHEAALRDFSFIELKHLFDHIVDNIDPNIIEIWEEEYGRKFRIEERDIIDLLGYSERSDLIDRLLTVFRRAISKGMAKGLTQFAEDIIVDWIKNTSNEKGVKVKFVVEDESNLATDLYLTMETERYLRHLSYDMDDNEIIEYENWISYFGIEDADNYLTDKHIVNKYYDPSVAKEYILEELGLS